MDLRKRLAQLDRLTQKPSQRDPGGEAQAPASTAEAGAALASLGLICREGPLGPVWYRDYQDKIITPPAILPDLTGFFTTRMSPGQRRDSLLFVDTETTGLAGGTGTLVFVLGCSWWSGEEFQTRQYFLPGPAAEPALLDELASLAAGFSRVLTYNGASFDLPLLRTRALLNRLADPMGQLSGWDLVVPARRLWRNCLPDCRQQTIETHLLGASRAAGDIEGSQIPQTWFDFLRTGEPGLLPNVLLHNHRDMLGMGVIFSSLCGVAAWLARADVRQAWPSGLALPDGTGAWALGRLSERRGQAALAGRCFAEGWRAVSGGQLDETRRQRFRLDAIRNLKRRQAWDLVEEIILDGLQCQAGNTALHIEAAILYEHRLVDWGRAHHHAREAGDTHRISRLERLLSNHAGHAGSGDESCR